MWTSVDVLYFSEQKPGCIWGYLVGLGDWGQENKEYTAFRQSLQGAGGLVSGCSLLLGASQLNLVGVNYEEFCRVNVSGSLPHRHLRKEMGQRIGSMFYIHFENKCVRERPMDHLPFFS